MLDIFPNDTRPMFAQTVDKQGRIWFISATDSQKNSDIAKDNRVMLTFQDESEHSYLAIYGHAKIYTD
jgi:general stress protein 26